MNSENKILALAVIVALLVGWSGASLMSSSDRLGGRIHNVLESFDAGIAVNGITVIDDSGNWVGAITGTTGTFSSTLGGYLEKSETHTASSTLVAADSGIVHYLGTADVDLLLPAATDSAGVVYRFVVSANFATDSVTVGGAESDSSDDLIDGVLTVNGALVPCAAEDTITFVNTAELIGDWVELRSNGTNWIISGQGTTAGSITCEDVD